MPKGPRAQRTIRLAEDLDRDLVHSAAAAGYKDVNTYVEDILETAKKAGAWPSAAPGQTRQPLPISA